MFGDNLVNWRNGKRSKPRWSAGIAGQTIYGTENREQRRLFMNGVSMCGS